MFYTLSQNNSGGHFDHDEVVGIAQYVVIEAASEEEAESHWDEIRAQYPESSSCPCCGKRWGYWCDSDSEFPSVYGRPIEQADAYGAKPGDVFGYIHYLDGRLEAVKQGGDKMLVRAVEIAAEHHLPESRQATEILLAARVARLEEGLAAMTERAERAERAREKDLALGVALVDAAERERDEQAREREADTAMAARWMGAADLWKTEAESLRAALIRAEAEVKRLREAMPTDAVMLDVRHALTVFEPEDDVSKWVARLDAVRKEVG